MIYYYEIENVMQGPKKKEFYSDEEAIKELTKHNGLEIIYDEDLRTVWIKE